MELITAPTELWFLHTCVSFPVSHGDGVDGISVMHSCAPRGDSPPLHVHRTEDEVFHVIDGELRFSIDGNIVPARAGDTAFAPKGVPHTYCVDSAEATWLAITTNGDFERFVRTLSRAERPSEIDEAELVQTAAENGIEFVGPPLT
jgi:quercetin dioxygenase-like cupin family protein